MSSGTAVSKYRLASSARPSFPTALRRSEADSPPSPYAREGREGAAGMDSHRSRRYRIPMADILTRIEAYKRDEIAAAKRARSRSAVEAAAKAAPPPRGFLAAIERRLAAGGSAPHSPNNETRPSPKPIPRALLPPAPPHRHPSR